jgi:hypothetical protein
LQKNFKRILKDVQAYLDGVWYCRSLSIQSYFSSLIYWNFFSVPWLLLQRDVSTECNVNMSLRTRARKKSIDL